jgi:hypothetical protein
MPPEVKVHYAGFSSAETNLVAAKPGGKPNLAAV